MNANVPKMGRGFPLPPHPQIDPLYTVCEKRLKNLGRGLFLPPHPQIDSIYTVCEKWTKKMGRALPPPYLDIIQKNSYFFCETFLNTPCCPLVCTLPSSRFLSFLLHLSTINNKTFNHWLFCLQTPWEWKWCGQWLVCKRRFQKNLKNPRLLEFIHYT